MAGRIGSEEMAARNDWMRRPQRVLVKIIHKEKEESTLWKEH